MNLQSWPPAKCFGCTLHNTYRFTDKNDNVCADTTYLGLFSETAQRSTCTTSSSQWTRRIRQYWRGPCRRAKQTMLSPPSPGIPLTTTDSSPLLCPVSPLLTNLNIQSTVDWDLNVTDPRFRASLLDITNPFQTQNLTTAPKLNNHKLS